MAQSFNTSLPQIIAKYARALNLAITKTSLLNTLQSNPYYPSLLSVSETFDKFKIENAGFKIAKEDFDKLTPPFLAYYFTPNAGKDFVLITKIESLLERGFCFIGSFL